MVPLISSLQLAPRTTTTTPTEREMTTLAKFYMIVMVMVIVTAEGKEEPPTPPLSPHQAFTQFVHESLEKYTQQANSVQDEEDNQNYMWTKLAKHIIGSNKDDSHSRHPPAVPPTAFPPTAFQMDDLASIFKSAMMKMNQQDDVEEDKERDLSSLAASVLSKSFLYGSSDHETEEKNE
ncbi:hypothetical protein Pcinc_015353 [Petrolisthes cinctipes]|uniref:Uncharacterized protein n=1 Tax=Petrolisthes cinctipes TaxID=88211 RepID=A0AAE1KN80_PETCI|nr:hypothetical protein Pcinc_015353 [Petrolisthes cinctipes]